MFRYESEMIPVLADSLTKKFNAEFITTEFGTGNGVADLVFSTQLSNEKLFLKDYNTMALFVNLFQKSRVLHSATIFERCSDKNRLRKLLNRLEADEFISISGDKITRTRRYSAHAGNLFSVEAKLKDWKSGFHQALRYKFFSHKSYLAFPDQFIHRVDLDLLRKYNIGLISVRMDGIDFIYQPKIEKPKDVVSYFFLSELFAQKFKEGISH